MASDSGDARRCEWQTPPGACPVIKKKKKNAASSAPRRKDPASFGGKVPRSLTALSPFSCPRGAAGNRGSCRQLLAMSRKPQAGSRPLPRSHRRDPEVALPGEGGPWAYPQPLPLLPPVIFSFSLFFCCPPTPSPRAGATESLRSGQVAQRKASRVWTPGGHLLPLTRAFPAPRFPRGFPEPWAPGRAPPGSVGRRAAPEEPRWEVGCAGEELDIRETRPWKRAFKEILPG